MDDLRGKLSQAEGEVDSSRSRAEHLQEQLDKSWCVQATPWHPREKHSASPAPESGQILKSEQVSCLSALLYLRDPDVSKERERQARQGLH